MRELSPCSHRAPARRSGHSGPGLGERGPRRVVPGPGRRARGPPVGGGLRAVLWPGGWVGLAGGAACRLGAGQAGEC